MSQDGDKMVKISGCYQFVTDLQTEKTLNASNECEFLCMQIATEFSQNLVYLKHKFRKSFTKNDVVAECESAALFFSLARQSH